MSKIIFIDNRKDRIQSPAAAEKMFLEMLSKQDIPVFFEQRLKKVEKED